MVFVAEKGVGVKSLKALGHSLVSLGFIGTETPMYRLKKIGLMVLYNIYAN